jgi:hypothetical protein
MQNTTKQVRNSTPTPTIKEKGVADLLKNVNPSKASGPDNIPNRVLKECAEELAPIFTTMYQHSIDTGELPHDWLNANISCIYIRVDTEMCCPKGKCGCQYFIPSNIIWFE